MKDFPEYEGSMAHWPHVEAIPGAKGTLDRLCERFVCAVASNAGASDSELMAQALAKVDMRRYSRHFFTSRELGVEKPDPIISLSRTCASFWQWWNCRGSRVVYL